MKDDSDASGDLSRQVDVCRSLGHGVRHRLGAPTIDEGQLARIRRLIAEL